MSEQTDETARPVVYNDGPVKAKQCPNHTHRRPIHLSTLTKAIYVREEIARRHRWHFMPEAGCPMCLNGEPRG